MSIDAKYPALNHEDTVWKVGTRLLPNLMELTKLGPWGEWLLRRTKGPCRRERLRRR